MRVYIDSSVILRIILAEPKPLREWSRITDANSSELARVECLRVLDRIRISGDMDDRELARRRASTIELFTGFELIRVNRPVLERAADPFPTSIRTLDAIHVSTALLLQEREPSLKFATHDDDLALAARAVGLKVIGS